MKSQFARYQDITNTYPNHHLLTPSIQHAYLTPQYSHQHYKSTTYCPHRITKPHMFSPHTSARGEVAGMRGGGEGERGRGGGGEGVIDVVSSAFSG